MLILDGKKLAQRQYEDLKLRAQSCQEKLGRSPCLVVVLVGEDPASTVYVRNKAKACENVGIKSEILRWPATVSIEDLKTKIQELNRDNAVDGFLIQLPLPRELKGFDPTDLVSPEKDVDGLSSANIGLMNTGQSLHEPCTPEGVMRILEHYDIPIEGQKAVVIGRSKTVGWPMAFMLTRANATVSVCHSKTKDLASYTREADIIVAAAGVPQMIKAKHIKKGAVVIDVGIHKRPEGKGLVGDVDFESLKDKAKAVSPVPGGVGPMTVAQLIEHTVQAAERKINPGG